MRAGGDAEEHAVTQAPWIRGRKSQSRDHRPFASSTELILSSGSSQKRLAFLRDCIFFFHLFFISIVPGDPDQSDHHPFFLGLFKGVFRKRLLPIDPLVLRYLYTFQIL